MLSPALNNVSPFAKNRGIALLMMLALILVAFTIIAVSRLSLSSGEQKERARTTKGLIESRNAIMAFALASAGRVNATDPPGRLPCPDGDGNGVSDPLPTSINPCTYQRGLVPFITLGISQPLDGSGAPIWYVVSQQYSGTVVTPFNSSRASSLRLNTQAVAFILLAPSEPFSGQNRPSLQPRSNPPANSAAQYLEAGNANQYSDTTTSTQNDVVMAMSTLDFWAGVEGRVLNELSTLLRAYRDSCGIYPWPALFANNNNISDSAPIPNTAYEGRVPLQTASPYNWGGVCPNNKNAPAVTSSWLLPHWGTMIYYAICKSAVSPANPPISKCLQLDINKTAEVIVISPGVPISGHLDRTTNPTTLSAYFEGQNITPGDNRFDQVKPVMDNFNDRILIVR